MVDGFLNVPPPILSQAYQTLSRGFVYLLFSKKIVGNQVSISVRAVHRNLPVLADHRCARYPERLFPRPRVCPGVLVDVVVLHGVPKPHCLPVGDSIWSWWLPLRFPLSLE